MTLRELLRRFGRKSVQAEFEEGERSVDNVDALSVAGTRNWSGQAGGSAPMAPPGYVKPDDGRPRH